MPAQSHAPGQPVDLARTAGSSLLLVDDDPLILDSLGFVLRERFELLVATTRKEAKRQAMSLPNR